MRAGSVRPSHPQPPRRVLLPSGVALIVFARSPVADGAAWPASRQPRSRPKSWRSPDTAIPGNSPRPSLGCPCKRASLPRSSVSRISSSSFNVARAIRLESEQRRYTGFVQRLVVPRVQPTPSNGGPTARSSACCWMAQTSIARMTQDAVKQVIDRRTVFRPGESVASMPAFDTRSAGRSSASISPRMSMTAEMRAAASTMSPVAAAIQDWDSGRSRVIRTSWT